MLVVKKNVSGQINKTAISRRPGGWLLAGVADFDDGLGLLIKVCGMLVAGDCSEFVDPLGDFRAILAGDALYGGFDLAGLGVDGDNDLMLHDWSPYEYLVQISWIVPSCRM